MAPLIAAKTIHFFIIKAGEQCAAAAAAANSEKGMRRERDASDMA